MKLPFYCQMLCPLLLHTAYKVGKLQRHSCSPNNCGMLIRCKPLNLSSPWALLQSFCGCCYGRQGRRWQRAWVVLKLFPVCCLGLSGLQVPSHVPRGHSFSCRGCSGAAGMWLVLLSSSVWQVGKSPWGLWEMIKAVRGQRKGRRYKVGWKQIWSIPQFDSLTSGISVKMAMSSGSNLLLCRALHQPLLCLVFPTNILLRGTWPSHVLLTTVPLKRKSKAQICTCPHVSHLVVLADKAFSELFNRMGCWEPHSS